MERKIANKLEIWKRSENRKPLIIYGARQVGKPHLALTFGNRKYKNTAYFNMEDSIELAAIFDRNLNPKGLYPSWKLKAVRLFSKQTP